MEYKKNTVLDILWQTGEFKSKSEIRELAKQEAIFMQVNYDDQIMWREKTLFKIGKKKFIKII